MPLETQSEPKEKIVFIQMVFYSRISLRFPRPVLITFMGVCTFSSLVCRIKTNCVIVSFYGFDFHLRPECIMRMKPLAARLRPAGGGSSGGKQNANSQPTCDRNFAPAQSPLATE